ncbi:hypothetical protein OHA72_42710 [Dactylosporangium sp. NBC_01737]|uniref:hypothetical protein n=1 Tax=Dactylosporangium sp. NBC_01737 TaxID=2975959 RepID=UPI002E122CA8|nr:hypothetical protein OHA72_42710 [Dactylosporangium sp. NBC_01737]
MLDGRLVQPVFQPIVDLSTRAVVGMEALARGPDVLRAPRPGFHQRPGTPFQVAAG